MAEKVSSIMADKLAASNNQTIESILNRLDKLNLKGTGQLLTPEVEILKSMSLTKLRTMTVTISLLLTVEISWWTMFIIKLVRCQNRT